MRAQAKSEQKPFSPLVLCDQLLTLAQQADTAGFKELAGQLVLLAHTACEPASALQSSHIRKMQIDIATTQS